MDKVGLVNFTKSIAIEYGKFGVHANAAVLRIIQTRALEDVRACEKTIGMRR